MQPDGHNEKGVCGIEYCFIQSFSMRSYGLSVYMFPECSSM
jgi:hypothetical protein